MRLDKVYRVNIDELFKEFSSSNIGLIDEKIEKNRKKYGTNIIKDSKRKSVFRVFFNQYLNYLVIILIAASILSYFTGGIENAVIILVVITLNAILGTVEYFKAEKSIQGLKRLSSLEATVLRNGNVIKIASDDVVCGDVVLVKSGDIVPCDIRIIESINLELDESMLTGESNLVEKNNEKLLVDASIGEMSNILFRGTKVITGKAKGIAYKVGMDTEIGKIAKLIQNVKKKKSPLEKDIDKFSKDLGVLILIICVIIFFMAIYRHISTVDSLMFSISLAVAAIPEALSTIVTIVLAISTEKMAKENAIIKDIKALETLGSVNVLCTDKTGTLTQNKMVVQGFFDGVKDIYKLNESLLKKCLILCNDSDITLNNLNKSNINTDDAIVLYFLKEDATDYMKIKNDYLRVFDNPFSSKRKMASVVTIIDNKKIMFVKGASDVVLSKCIIDASNKRQILEKINQKSESGYRVLALAYKEVNNDYLEDNLIFLGLVYLVDPIKENVKETISDLIKHSIKPVMITGDHKLTAISIAKEVGISYEKTITGYELEKISDDDLLNIINDITIFARVSPTDKIRIVTSFQKKGCNVAFIGDGVNDAPAIKKADVGVSMGISGTDVSKEASDVILLDDNLQTVIKAVKRGRKVYQNIKNAILYLIAGNLAGIFIVLFTTFCNLPIPFAPIHLLFINLINDSLPAIAIGIEENYTDEKALRTPRNVKSPIISKRVLRRICVEGFLIALCTIISFYVGYKDNIYVSRTMVFVTITIARLFYSFNCRGRFSFIKLHRNKEKPNKALLFSIVFGLIMVNLLLFVPVLMNMFSISKLSKYQLIIAYSLGLIPMIVIQVMFIVRDFINRNKP